MRNVGWSEQPRSALALALSMTISPEHASSLFYLATTYLYFLSFPVPTAGSNAPLLCHPPAPKDVKAAQLSVSSWSILSSVLPREHSPPKPPLKLTGDCPARLRMPGQLTLRGHDMY
ncbi:uncharacterized protein LOC144287744 [Canis aureus]